MAAYAAYATGFFSAAVVVVALAFASLLRPAHAQAAEDPFAAGGALEGTDSEEAPGWHDTVWGLAIFFLMVFPVIAFGYHAAKQNKAAQAQNSANALFQQSLMPQSAAQQKAAARDKRDTAHLDELSTSMSDMVLAPAENDDEDAED